MCSDTKRHEDCENSENVLGDGPKQATVELNRVNHTSYVYTHRHVTLMMENDEKQAS